MSGPARDTPEISVVVAPTETGASLPGCLEALEAQVNAPPFEVLVPFDSSVEGLAAMRRRFPRTRWIRVPDPGGIARSRDIGLRHLAIDRRRSAALAAARAPLVGLTEEHGRPAPDWCAQIAALHAELPHPVIGGGIENARDRIVNWALFFGDGGRYQQPVPEGPARFVSDVNVSYKAAALHAVRDSWRDHYHETGVHAAIEAGGGTLWLSPRLRMLQDRGHVPLGAAIRERFAWARLFAGRRAAESPGPRRWVWAAGSPVLGPLLLWRQTTTALRRGRHRGALARTLPLLALMDAVWGVGELTGYVTGRASGSEEPLEPS